MVVELLGTGSATVVVRFTIVVVVVGGGAETVSSLEHALNMVATPMNKIRQDNVFMLR